MNKTEKEKIVLTIIRQSMPIKAQFAKAKIELNRSSLIMADLGIKPRAYRQALSDIEDECSIEEHPEIVSEYMYVDRKILKMFPPKVKSQYQLSVPDITIDELINIAISGIWPKEYYDLIN